MLKILFIIFIGFMSLQAEDTLSVNEFKASIFSRVSKKPVQIETSLIFEGRDVEEYDFKIIDVLNIIIGSFYVENLLTSKGKEGLKETIIKYASNKYGIDIDNIYIQKLNIVKNTTAKTIIDELRKEGYIRK